MYKTPFGKSGHIYIVISYDTKFWREKILMEQFTPRDNILVNVQNYQSTYNNNYVLTFTSQMGSKSSTTVGRG